VSDRASRVTCPVPVAQFRATACIVQRRRQIANLAPFRTAQLHPHM